MLAVGRHPGGGRGAGEGGEGMRAAAGRRRQRHAGGDEASAPKRSVRICRTKSRDRRERRGAQREHKRCEGGQIAALAGCAWAAFSLGLSSMSFISMLEVSPKATVTCKQLEFA